MSWCVLSVKKVLVFFTLFAVFAVFQLYSADGDWVIGAMKFNCGQNAGVPLQKAARDLPAAMLELIGNDTGHLLSESEKRNRALYELQTDRLSYFLQLSREIKVRDSLFLTETNEKKLKKKLAEQEAKISEISARIRKNLEVTEARKSGIFKEEEEVSFFKRVKASIRQVPQDDSPSVERIMLYNGDSTSLYEGEADFPNAEAKSVSFVKSGLNALITGEIQKYGDFISVTADLTLYPGGESAGSVTEIGEMNELKELSENLVLSLMPKIANAFSMKVCFDITPQEAVSSAQIFIDKVLLPAGRTETEVTYGEHKIEVSCEGYFTKSVSYKFTEMGKYVVEVPLEKMEDGTFHLTLDGLEVGEAYTNGTIVARLDDSKLNMPVKINGQPVLGVFVPEQNSAENFYYYVSDEVQDGEFASVKYRPHASAADIDNRRQWSYKGYSAFILTLPVAFLSYGQYITLKKGYDRGAESSETVNNWATISNVATGLAVLSGGFFIFELVRYLRSASTVLPQEAKTIDWTDMTGNGMQGDN